MGMVSCWWAGWNEKSLLSPWKQNIFLWIFWLFGLFCQANEKRLWGPLISGPPEDAFKFLFLFPSWFLTNASRRSLSGPRDSSGWSITCRTSASQKIIHEWEGFLSSTGIPETHVRGTQVGILGCSEWSSVSSVWWGNRQLQTTQWSLPELKKQRHTLTNGKKEGRQDRANGRVREIFLDTMT